ncbi:MAG: hypothetical protein AUK47_25725 [Deltaproteobacteria bacterium CG2_30_63_29]|nr:MAG: hypothetical protein AUK47_25725 [Deltaproteobacteria bacterium CG2_30_63_29]
MLPCLRAQIVILIACITLFVVTSALARSACAGEHAPPEISWLAAGGGVGSAQTVHFDFSAWPGLDWLSIDAMLGTFLFATVTARGGLTLHWGGQEAFSEPEAPHDAWLIHLEAGVDHGFLGWCLNVCYPPKQEGVVSASTGYGWVSDAWIARLQIGADYRWGKRPDSVETRFVFKGPFAPSVSLWFGMRL